MKDKLEQYAELYNAAEPNAEQLHRLERELAAEVMEEYGWKLVNGKWIRKWIVR